MNVGADFKNSTFLTSVNAEAPAQNTGITMMQVKVKQLQCRIGEP